MGIVYENRPYIIVKQLRVRDLRDDDIVFVPTGAADEHRWMLWSDAPQWQDDIDLLDVQVREVLPTTYQDYPPGQDPRDGLPLKKSS